MYQRKSARLAAQGSLPKAKSGKNINKKKTGTTGGKYTLNHEKMDNRYTLGFHLLRARSAEAGSHEPLPIPIMEYLIEKMISSGTDTESAMAAIINDLTGMYSRDRVKAVLDYYNGTLWYKDLHGRYHLCKPE